MVVYKVEPDLEEKKRQALRMTSLPRFHHRPISHKWGSHPYISWTSQLKWILLRATLRNRGTKPLRLSLLLSWVRFMMGYHKKGLANQVSAWQFKMIPSWVYWKTFFPRNRPEVLFAKTVIWVRFRGKVSYQDVVEILGGGTNNHTGR